MTDDGATVHDGPAMSDDSSNKASQESFLGGKAPDALVKGGTHTTRSENHFNKLHADAEERRNIADKERAAARGQREVANPEDPRAKILLPGEIGKGAVQYSTQFTENPEIGKAYLAILVPSLGELCCADLIKGIDPANPDELTIIIVCPGCIQDGHKKQDQCQLQIRQSNKNFTFFPGEGPPDFEFQDPESGLYVKYRNAGMIGESEPFSCGDCNGRYRIVANVLLEDRG